MSPGPMAADGATTESVEKLRDEGNEAFKSGDMAKAVELYTLGLAAATATDGQLKATLHRNRAMARLKLADAAGTEADCTAALEFDRADSKALYRRALAREQLGNVGEAFSDAKLALRFEPKDKNITQLLQRLAKANQVKQEEALTTDSRVREMDKLAFAAGGAGDADQRERAINNLLVLARESETGAQRVWADGAVVSKLLGVIRNDPSEDTVIAAVRTLDELSKNPTRSMKLIQLIGVPELCRLLCARPWPKFIDASGLVVQRLFNALAKMDRVKNIKPDEEVAEANKVLIIKVILELEEMMTDKEVSGPVRNTVVDLILKNLMHMDGGLPRGWSWRFVEDRGLLKLLHVSCQIPEQCEYPVTAETRQHVAICLQRLYDDMVFDTKRNIFKERLDQFFNAKMSQSDKLEVQVQICALLTTLLQSVVDMGMTLVTNDKVTAMMLTMAGSDNILHQTVAAELIVQTVSKRERATTILSVGVPILKKLYDSENEEVKVRALMGLCKCASAGGDDVSRQTMQEGSTLKLAQTCKRFMLDINKYSVLIRRFACEGLSYLSLDADVKEWIVEDPLLIRALVELAKAAGSLCVYSVASIFVNLTNTYEKPQVNEELVKLAQFAKHHVPETHPKDTDDFVDRRIELLVQEGATAACVAISKTESKNSLELLARSLFAFSSKPEHRGRVIKEGGARLALELTKSATPEGQIKAAHALARLGANSDPAIAFPGQRAYEVVKPMVDLLHPDIEGLPNYDALLTLTNLASMSDSVRKRILKERAIPKVEEYWFMTDNNELRGAAAELLLNLLYCEEFVKMTVEPGTDRLKLWVLSCSEENERIALASSAGFVLLTEDNLPACQRILDEISTWPELFKELCMAEHVEVQRRCLMAIANMMECDEKIAARIMQTEVFRVMVAITKLKHKARAGAQEQAQRALAAAEKFGLIAATDREAYERKTNLSTVRED